MHVLCDNIVNPINQKMKHVAAIVSPCDQTLSCGSGLSKIRMDAAGPEVKKYCWNRVAGGPVMVTGMFVTNAGKLTSKFPGLKHIIHAVGPDPEECRYDWNAVWAYTCDTYFNCLLQANHMQYCSSIAMHPLGAGTVAFITFINNSVYGL